MASAEKAKDEKAAVPSASESHSKEGGNKLVSILSIVNLVATLGILGVLFISFQKEKKRVSIDQISTEEGADSEKKEGEKPSAEHGEHAEKSESKPKESKPADSGKMIDLNQFTVNLSTPGSSNPKFVRVGISLDVPNEGVEAEIKNKLPQVQNAIIDLFNSKKTSDLEVIEGRETLKEEIKNALNHFLTSGKVNGVYFTSFTLAG